MAANGPFPVGSTVILRRFAKGGWQVMSAYPPGYTIPSSGMPLEFRSRDLDKVYDYLLEFHEDDKIAAGHPAARDETSPPGSIPNGALVRMERRTDGWHAIVDYPEGGMSFRFGAYDSIGAVLEGMKLQYGAS